MPDKKVVVMGGGIAGLTAARELSQMGVSAVVVEKGDFLGGHAAHYACKAAPECQKCSACEVDKAIKEFIHSHNDVGVLLRSAVKSVTKKNGRFDVAVDREPAHVDPELCTNCGLCMPSGAMVEAPNAYGCPRFAIKEELRGTNDPKCKAAAEACPEGAIKLDAKAGQAVVEADGIVVATGFAPFDAAEKPQFGFGSHPDIITAVELEQTLRDRGALRRPSNGEPVEKVAFVQCVGSRDKDRPYCSKVCCGYSLRMAEAIKDRWPGTEISMFYIDIQPVGKATEAYLAKYRNDLALVRTMVGDIYPVESGRLRLTYQDQVDRAIIDEEYDLAVLAVAITPGKDSDVVGGAMELQRDAVGFFAGDNALETNLTGKDCVVVAGTATGPMDIATTVAHSKRAAWKVARMIGV